MHNDNEKSDAMAILERIEERGKQTELAVHAFGERLEGVVTDIGALKRQAAVAQKTGVDHAKAIEDVRREARERARKSSEDLTEFKQESADKEGALLRHLSQLTESQAPVLAKLARSAKPALTVAGGFTGAALANFLSELARNPAPLHDLIHAITHIF